MDDLARPAADAEPELRVRGLQAWYGESHVLHGIDFDIAVGEVVTLLGRNGAGKTTTLKSIMGMIRKRSGSVVLSGRELIKSPARDIARAGFGYCPEERGIFSALSVHENLVLPPIIRAGGMTDTEVFALFPNLSERLDTPGTKLSGGEQQMLAIARILRTGAYLLLLDEPTEGLAPVIVEQIRATITRLKAKGYTILLVEQNLSFALDVADHNVVIEQGRVVDVLSRGDVAAGMARLQTYLGV